MISNNWNIKKISDYAWKENDKYLIKKYFSIPMNSRLPLKIDLFYFKSDNKKKLMLNLKIDQKKKLKKLKKLKKKIK